MHRRRILLMAVMLLSGTALGAQQLPTPTGTKVIEILGLRTWTRRMIEDSVARFQPGITLADHACAAILRDDVGFADAAVTEFTGPHDTTWVAIWVVEPALRHLVRFRSYSRKAAAEPIWSDIRDILREHQDAAMPLQEAPVLLAGADSWSFGPVSADTRALRAAIRRHSSQRDWDIARQAVLSDSNAENRAVAALVLSNFASRDSAYYLLMEGMRASDFGQSFAEMVLKALARGAPRHVNWAPARDALTALVGGTGLFGYTTVLAVLTSTDVDRQLGLELARTNSALLLDHMGVRNPYIGTAAHAFLVHIRGQDLGSDVDAWKAWLAGKDVPSL